MKKTLLFAVPLLAAVNPTVASAQETRAVAVGPRVELMVGLDKFKGNFSFATGGKEDESAALYGLGVGYDFIVANNITAGVDVELADTTFDYDVLAEDEELLGQFSAGPEFYVGGRVTGKISDKLALVGKLGWSRIRTKFNGEDSADDDKSRFRGPRAAIGLRFDSDERVYYGFDLRYSNYKQGVSRQGAVLFVGTRF